MPAFIDRTGDRFGRLTVESIHSRATRANGPTKWNCRCDCGNIVAVVTSKLSTGHTQSCGCLMLERASAANMKHGYTPYANGGVYVKEYNTWSLMLRRCSKLDGQDAALYALRGIAVCERWRDFRNFIADMGDAPSPKHSIDRIDNDKGYEPGNCRWATPKEQRRNQRSAVLIEYAGQCKTPMEWQEELGISHKAIYNRMKVLGWSVERTLTTPVRGCHR